MTFEFTLSQNGQDAHVTMQGYLDERAQMPAAGTIPPGTLTVDLAGVSLINSLGCRRWLTWINEVSRRVSRVNLARCSLAVVQQLNVLGGFVPEGAVVTSFFVPYECPRCGHHARVLHEAGPDFHPHAVPESLTCVLCGDRMALEIMRQSYFKFLGARAS